ncbi:amidophosphoribosyltransferase-like [Coccinella septempunctata]|uniref:amidophosphoribosyltransferase-like n=1 Tax=Coccinella septempunctata TaxID=41139 RepID=UPI001D08512A|nr:amidophosphoribosyltransferase-like [Coccinella septempunctata]
MDSITSFKKRKEEKVKSLAGLTHECGVFGAIGKKVFEGNNKSEIAHIVYIGLEALQHRGQESTGLVTSIGNNDFHIHKGMGLVKDVFKKDDLKNLVGHIGIGHTRYSTSGASTNVHSQPFVVHSMHGSLAVAHNGELVNCDSLRKMVLDRGVGLSTHSDSELITQALCLIPPDGEVNGPDWVARIRHVMHLAPLSYSLVIMLKDRIYAVRDPYGNRPLCLGKILTQENERNNQHTTLNGHDQEDDLEDCDGWVVSSESCAFLNHMRYLREVLPGEIVEITQEGAKTMDIVPLPVGKPLAFCIFEYVYFAKPNSIFEGQEVYEVRMECGKQLAIESPVEADVVGSVPESGNAAAHGYSQKTGIPFRELLAKNNYVGRTFIQPCNRMRQVKVALKFSAISSNVRGKRIILIDDSIVRGNTMSPIIKLLRRAGALEVHIRVASPPIKHPCYMGINIPTSEELIANKLKSDDIAKKVDADSLEYLSVEGLLEAVQRNNPNKKKGHCTACLTGIYPGGIPQDLEW